MLPTPTTSPRIPTLTAMKALLPFSLLLLSPALALDECQACKRGKICKPHVRVEEAEFRRLRSELESDVDDDRIGALIQIAALTQEHENVPSGNVARILATALEDESLRVRELALELLTDGQHPEIAVVGLVNVIEHLKRNMFGLVPSLTGAKQERGTTADAMNYIETIMRVSGQVPDDRVVKALINVLTAMPWEMYGQPVAMAATRSLLDLGTRDAVKAVLRQFNSESTEEEMQAVHEALTDFALYLDLEDPPEYGKKVRKQWDRWLKKHGRSLPKKLGKWRGKLAEEEEDKQKDADEDDEGPSHRSSATWSSAAGRDAPIPHRARPVSLRRPSRARVSVAAARLR